MTEEKQVMSFIIGPQNDSITDKLLFFDLNRHSVLDQLENTQSSLSDKNYR